jgi:hypothetical protein
MFIYRKSLYGTSVIIQDSISGFLEIAIKPKFFIRLFEGDSLERQICLAEQRLFNMSFRRVYEIQSFKFRLHQTV